MAIDQPESSRDGLNHRKGFISQVEETPNLVNDLPHNIFDNNDQGLVDNPFRHLDPEDVADRSRQFAIDCGLPTLKDLFVKAGLILQDPPCWKSVQDLTEEEQEALEQDYKATKGFWQQPKILRVTITALCVAAVVQGWNQTALNGANLYWPAQLGLEDYNGSKPSDKSAWVFAIVNAGMYLSASLVGCWMSDPLNEYFFGRRAAVFISALVILAASIGSAASQTWQQLLACRLLLGIGMGAKASVVPVFAAEVSPAHLRGSLVMNWQLFDACGIFLGFTANLAVSQIPRTAWRWQIASSVIPTIPLLTLIWVCPDSPRFLMKHGRYKDAYQTFLLLRGHAILAAKELLYVHSQMTVEISLLSEKQPKINGQEHGNTSTVETPTLSAQRKLWRPWKPRSINYWQKLGQLFTEKRIRRATVSAVVVMLAQQMCGVNVLAFYSGTLFCDADACEPQDGNLQDSTYLRPLFLSWGIGLVNFVFAFPAYYLIDRKGRRWLLLVTIPFLALTILAAGLSFLIHDSSRAQLPVIGLWTYVFMFFYSWGMGPVPFTLSVSTTVFTKCNTSRNMLMNSTAEVFPLENRLAGMSFAVFTNMLGCGLLALFVPVLTNVIGHPGMLGIFAVLNAVAFVLVFFFVRETAGAALPMSNTFGSMTSMSLEELNYIFGVTTKLHAQYQRQVVVPWAWKYYIQRDKADMQPQKLHPWVSAKKRRQVNKEGNGG